MDIVEEARRVAKSHMRDGERYTASLLERLADKIEAGKHPDATLLLRAIERIAKGGERVSGVWANFSAKECYDIAEEAMKAAAHAESARDK